MIELLLCSMVTILPDYLFRRYVQGKRVGHEITFYSVWFELRWGIITCLLLTITLITLIFYYHPSTTSVTAVFRTVTILPEIGGRVEEVYVTDNETVEAGAPLFRLDSSKQQAAVDAAQTQIAEVDAQLAVAEKELAGADGQVTQAQGAYKQALDELNTKQELLNRDASTVSQREVERLQTVVDTREGGVASAIANRQSVETKINTLLPAQKKSAEAALAQAQVELDKTLVVAGVSGVVQQFTLRPGDVVNPLLRPAGILVPSEAGRKALIAGFGQIEAQVLKVGMIGEAACIGKPFTIIPLVITRIQPVIAAGQIRPSDQLIDVQQTANPGTITVYMEPLFEGGLENIPPGSSCVANAYTSNHEKLASGEVTGLHAVFLHAIGAMGVVHAAILRVQALRLPVETLVLGGH
ncbi:HlyD family secretion protein [Hoeflea sp. WL0058]|uniref:HlyD family secretion protein n=1 Tax=Flavimaribacter sediminis TaxID=2865987 RepID=A0AAE3D067_9HYPH|nr:HlyD family secretion protein [Flavimaribacter sediminis]MBW8638150.1 HlyD family secretion protein [Flavimaribacter sediminis]